jgi:hypothetical protein
MADIKYKEAAPGKPGVYESADGSAVAVSYQSDDPGYASGANYDLSSGVQAGAYTRPLLC